MQKYIETLKRTQLFSGVGDNEISAMLNCLQARLLTFKRGDYVFREGEHIDNITVLLNGKLLVQHDDFWGNRNIVNVIHVGEMFGEAYVAPESGSLLNDVIAEEDSTVFFLILNASLLYAQLHVVFIPWSYKTYFFQSLKRIENLFKRSGICQNVPLALNFYPIFRKKQKDITIDNS